MMRGLGYPPGLRGGLLTRPAAGGGVTYLLRDEFTTDAAAGFSSPCDASHVGRLYRSADTNNRVSLTDGDLRVNGASAVNYADPAYYWTDADGNGFSRQPGRALLFRVIPKDILRLGFSNAPTVVGTSQYGFQFNSGGAIGVGHGSNSATIGAWSALTTYLIAVVLRGDGAGLYVKGGAYADWSRLFTMSLWTDATLYPALSTLGTVDARMADVRLSDDSGVFLTGEDTLSQAIPVSGTLYAGDADGNILLNYTSPSGASGRFIELRYRVADENNYMVARVQWNGTAWEMVTGHVIAGSETLQGTPVSPGASSRIQVRAVGSNHDYWTATGGAFTKRYATISDSNGAANTGVMVVQNGGFTLSRLMSAPYQHARYAPLDRLAE